MLFDDERGLLPTDVGMAMKSSVFSAILQQSGSTAARMEGDEERLRRLVGLFTVGKSMKVFLTTAPTLLKQSLCAAQTSAARKDSAGTLLVLTIYAKLLRARFA